MASLTPAQIEEKFVGSMVGLALGDAIGELAFRHPSRPKVIRAVEDSPMLAYTDDTAMALGLAQSILATGTIDQQDLGETFRKNFEREPWRGYASGPPTIFSMVKRHGIPYVEAARRLFGGSGSFGNGAAMRIAPVGLYFFRSPNIYEMACASAEVTHAHPVGRDGAAVLAVAIAFVAHLEPSGEFPLEEFGKTLIDECRTLQIREGISFALEAVSKGTPAREVVRVIGRSVAMDRSMPFSLFAFLSHPHSFEEAIFCSILNGGDRDTLGAMTGAISGAYLGSRAIPEPWRAKLENLQMVETLARELAKRAPMTH
jgi:poly(ADP-ribose) glycohydrolase ARH3